ncbi:MAG: type-F conjugative transfer system secretin TraK [Alphaproteobacteria bacterium]|nr:type-F conjugative transfer system secretin TraK [Alphaproteobacteria bacterium]
MNKFIYFYLLQLIGLGTSLTLYAAQTHTLHEGKRIQATICPNEMNRISIQGDRIAQVFGAEGKFTHQVDEETGQFFLKPIPSQMEGNSYTPFSLTLITESGLTQDLTLIPKEKTAATIVLKPTSIVSNKSTNTPFFSLTDLNRALPHQEALIQGLRALVSGDGKGMQDEDLLSTPPMRSNTSGLTARFLWQVKGSYSLGQVFEIINTNLDSETVQEKQFFQTGDLALAVTKTTLMPQEKAILYVIRREGV